MNFLPALNPYWFLALGAVPIGIILLYFLKLRRRPMEVPSTFLWERTIEDLHVNSLLQRLRTSLLLLLQLLFAALVILAILRPGWQSEDTKDRHLIFLLDTSASMSATDGDEEATRFERAKGEIRQQIDALGSRDEAMVIAFSDRADVLQGFTSDSSSLIAALDRANLTARPTDMLEALRAAAGLANPNRTSQAGDVNDVQVADAIPADLLIYSDGKVGNVIDFNLGNLTPTYNKIGSSAIDNIAVLAFSAERNLEAPDQIEVFAQVANLGLFRRQGTAALRLDGELVDAESIDMDAGEEIGLSFNLEAGDASELTLTIEDSNGRPLEDDLPVDHTAYAALTPLRQVSVLLVTPGNTALELALGTEQARILGRVEVKAPNFLSTDTYRERAERGQDDLIVFDRCAPESMPPANTFFIGALPNEGWQWGEMTGPVLPIDIDRTHPIMRFLELFSLRIVEGRALEPPRGSTTLISADIGPVLALAPRAGFQDLVMGFDVVSQTEDGRSAFNTDWPVQRSWPVFAFNLMRNLGGAVDTSGAASIRPGETIPLRVDNRLRTVRVERPDGESEQLSVGPAGIVPYANTDAPGVYHVFSESSESPLNLFAVNLFDRRESDLAAADSIELGYESIEGGEVAVPQRSEAWRWILLGALGILAAEWFVFNRRLL